MDLIRDFINSTVPGSAHYTSYPGGHCCWDTWYGTTWKDTDGESIYTWMLKQNKSGVSPNQPPVANAGADQVITLPVNSVTLSGSATDADGSVFSYQWNKISGPNQFTIESPTGANTKVNNLVDGQYEFQLAVTDDKGGIGKDTVKLIVNRPSSFKALLYPNPATGDVVTIKLETPTYRSYSSIVIYNANGAIVYTQNLLITQAITNTQIDITKLPPSFYLIEIAADINTDIVIKMIRQ